MLTQYFAAGNDLESYDNPHGSLPISEAVSLVVCPVWLI
jgi:hypothetical protein